jgi:hypothetical protein
LRPPWHRLSKPRLKRLPMRLRRNDRGKRAEG